MESKYSGSDQLPELEEYMDRASALELARRSLMGAPVYTVISLIMLAGTPVLMDLGPWSVAEAILLLMLGVVRVWFALGFERRYDSIGERAVIQFSIMTALQSLALGVLSAMVIWQYWAAQEVILTIVLSACCIAAGTSALSVRRSAHLTFLACVLAPFGFAVFLVGGAAQAALIVGFLSLMAFLVQDGGQAKRAYFDRLKEHYSEQILRRRDALEIQAKQGFIKEIGHEIRAPVNSIVGMAALLMDEKLGKRPREIAETIRRSGNALLKLVGNVPGSIRSSFDLPDSHFGALDMNQCVTDVIKLYALEAREKGVEIKLELEDIPEGVLLCEESQFEQVLANLLANALEFTKQGSITLSSSSVTGEHGGMLIEFSIADTGSGIPAEYRESVFNPFGVKGAKISGKYGGDGLGLPLCKGLVELMGGDIWIEDNEDRGTVVKFTVRAELDLNEAPGEQDEKKGDASSALDAGRKLEAFGDLSMVHPHRILVVDDDDIHRQIVCVQLNKMGYSADEAADGEQAVAAVMQGNYDLIFMDLRMPNMSGIESTHWIRERFSGDGELRIIALTGDATIEAREQCMQAGMDNFVTKPVQVKDLEAILSNTSHERYMGVRIRHSGSMHWSNEKSGE